MLFLERMAEEKILQALERGEFDDLPGKGKPIPEEEDLTFVPQEMRVAYRIMRNAGFVPEEVGILREIEDLTRILEAKEGESNERPQTRKRLQLLMGRLGDLRGGNLNLADAYYLRISEKLGRNAANELT